MKSLLDSGLTQTSITWLQSVQYHDCFLFIPLFPMSEVNPQSEVSNVSLISVNSTFSSSDVLSDFFSIIPRSLSIISNYFSFFSFPMSLQIPKRNLFVNSEKMSDPFTFRLNIQNIIVVFIFGKFCFPQTLFFSNLEC